MKTRTNNTGHTYLIDFMNCTNCCFLVRGAVNEPYISEEYIPESEVKWHCRKYAPRIFYGAGENWSSQMFPVINNPEHFWCGDFQIE